MIKSVTIKDRSGDLLLKILACKNGEYEMVQRADTLDLKIDVRDGKGHKVILG